MEHSEHEHNKYVVVTLHCGCQNSKLGSLDANSSSGKAGVELKHSAGPSKTRGPRPWPSWPVP